MQLNCNWRRGWLRVVVGVGRFVMETFSGGKKRLMRRAKKAKGRTGSVHRPHHSLALASWSSFLHKPLIRNEPRRRKLNLFSKWELQINPLRFLHLLNSAVWSSELLKSEDGPTYIPSFLPCVFLNMAPYVHCMQSISIEASSVKIEYLSSRTHSLYLVLSLVQTWAFWMTLLA